MQKSRSTTSAQAFVTSPNPLKYPVDRLKIDQSFILKAVTEPNAATVVRAILSMSHHLGIKVTAEGVETTEHLKILERRNCDEARVFIFRVE